MRVDLGALHGTVPDESPLENCVVKMMVRAELAKQNTFHWHESLVHNRVRVCILIVKWGTGRRHVTPLNVCVCGFCELL